MTTGDLYRDNQRLRELLADAEQRLADAEQSRDGSRWQTGEPREDWPEGFWLNTRTQEMIMVGQQFGVSSVCRGVGSTIAEANPRDAWMRIARKEGE